MAWLDETPTAARRDFFDAECAAAGVAPSDHAFRIWLDRHLDAIGQHVQACHDNMTRNDPRPPPIGTSREDEEDDFWRHYTTRMR